MNALPRDAIERAHVENLHAAAWRLIALQLLAASERLLERPLGRSVEQFRDRVSVLRVHIEELGGPDHVSASVCGAGDPSIYFGEEG